MTVLLLLLLGLAQAADTDTSPAAAAAADTDAPSLDNNAVDTDLPSPDEAPADTDAPSPDEATVDTEPPPPRTWPGWDTFVGPTAPPPDQPRSRPEEHETAHPDTDEHVAHDAAAPTPAPPARPAAATAAETAGELADVMGDEATPADGPGPSDGPSPYPRFLPFLPTLPLRGWRVGLLLAVVTGVSWGLARLIDPARDWLAPTGLLPNIAAAAQQVLRVVALFFALGVIAAIIPANLEPALPWVVLAGALALGWSTREVTPDFIAGIVLAAERKVRPGRWVGTRHITGVVEQVTLRVTWVRDATGRRVAVPNRAFLRDSVVTDRGQWPSVEVVVRIPGAHKPSMVRRIIEDAVLVSPWSAPLPPELIREEQDAGLWRVRARVLEGRFADRFEGALREHVEEVLQTGTGLRAEVSRRLEDE